MTFVVSLIYVLYGLIVLPYLLNHRVRTAAIQRGARYKTLYATGKRSGVERHVGAGLSSHAPDYNRQQRQTGHKLKQTS